MRVKSLLRNEDGSVIVLALVMLVLLTIIGMSASSTSTIEVQIAGNAARAKQNLYSAEAAAMEAVQLLEDENDENNLVPPATLTWLNGDLGDISNPSTIPSQRVSATAGNPSYAAVFRGVTEATSLGVTSDSQLFTYDVYGIYSGNGVSQVVVGYKKRF